MDSLVELFTNACREHGDLTAYSCEGATLSYRQLGKYSDKVAAWLLFESTLEPGDRVAIQLPNILQYPVMALGVLKAGMIIVNINPLYTPGETEHQLIDSGARALVTLEEIQHVSARILPGTEIRKLILTRAADFHPWYQRLPYKLALKLRRALNRMSRLGKQGRREDGREKTIRFSGRMKFTTLLRRGKKLLGRRVGRRVGRRGLPGNMESPGTTDKSSLGLIQYTGGTTGKAKGAMLSHGNLCANVRQIDSVMAGFSPLPGSIIVAPLPFYHIYAFTLNLLYSLYKGYHNVLIPDPRNTDRMVKVIRRYRITGFVGVSTLYQVLCRHPGFRALDFSGLTICTSGGMAMSVTTARRWEKLTGCRILEGYGLTETSPLVASGSYQDYREEKIGKATPWTEIRIIDEEGNVLPPGQAGEIIVRGPQVMQGYWCQPEETQAVLREGGWLHTGDVGILDEEGCLSVVDRIKDLILVSGFNVYPAEIEDYVSRHPDIREAAAIGVPMEEGEYVKLFVIADNPNLNEEEVIHFCRQGLTPYKVPGKVEFRASLPRSSVGKVLRRQLREDQVA